MIRNLSWHSSWHYCWSQCPSLSWRLGFFHYRKERPDTQVPPEIVTRTSLQQKGGEPGSWRRGYGEPLCSLRAHREERRFAEPVNGMRYVNWIDSYGEPLPRMPPLGFRHHLEPRGIQLVRCYSGRRAALQRQGCTKRILLLLAMKLFQSFCVFTYERERKLVAAQNEHDYDIH